MTAAVRHSVRLTMNRLAITFALLGSVACGGEPSGEQQPGASDQRTDTPGAPAGSARNESAAGPSSPEAWLDSAFLPATTGIDGVVERFGSPERRSATPRPNRHDPEQTDSILTLDFAEGVTARFYAVTGGRTFLSEAVVSEPGILRPGAVDVGSPWEEVRAFLGAPDGTRGGDPYYVCETCGEVDEPVYFEVQDGLVRRVRITYYVD